MEREKKHFTYAPSRDRILHFNSHNEPVSIDLDNVLFFNAYGSCSKAYMDNKKVKSVGRGLCHIEELVESRGENFLRCHNCWLVNVSKIVSYYEKDRLLIIAGYGIQVSVRKWRDARWIISDNDIKRIKMLSPEIEILPPYYQNNEQILNNPD